MGMSESICPRILPAESHEQRTLVGYCPWGHKELNMTKRLSMHTYPNLYLCITSISLLPLLVLSLTLEEMLSVFTTECDVSCRFVIYISLYCVELCSLCATVWRVFNRKQELNFVKSFFFIY